jgi:hypothetical protein
MNNEVICNAFMHKETGEIAFILTGDKHTNFDDWFDVTISKCATSSAADTITLPITEYEAKMSAGDQMAELCLAIYEAKKVTPEQYELMQQLAFAFKY